MQISNQQRRLIDEVRHDGIHGIYRKARNTFVTAKQLAVFNPTCADGKKRIQWHAPHWVAMDRVTYEKLIREVEKPTANMLILDEYAERNDYGRVKK